jgi:hypothetical protein
LNISWSHGAPRRGSRVNRSEVAAASAKQSVAGCHSGVNYAGYGWVFFAYDLSKDGPATRLMACRIRSFDLSYNPIFHQ